MKAVTHIGLQQIPSLEKLFQTGLSIQMLFKKTVFGKFLLCFSDGRLQQIY